MPAKAATPQVSGEFIFLQDSATALSDTNVSQGSVATHLRCGRIFNYSFVANLLLSVGLPVKEFWKLEIGQ